MTDIAIGETPPELVPPVPPEAPAELDAATPEAGAPAVGEVESFDRRISIPESLGPVRRAILEGLIDTEGPMSVSQLHAVMPPGTPRSTAEASILREFRSGRIERVSAGHYVLAKPKPPEAKPSSPPPPPTPDEEATWFVALEAWLVDRASWDVEKLGPRPNEPDNRIPPDIRMRFADRLRKRQERRREAEVAAAKRAAADRELRDKLLAAANGNFQPGPTLDDVGPIREVLKVLPLDRVLMVIRQKIDRRSYPTHPPLVSWRGPAFLRALAEDFCRAFAVPGLVKEWSAAGTAPAKPAGASGASPAVQVPAAPEEDRNGST